MVIHDKFSIRYSYIWRIGEFNVGRQFYEHCRVAILLVWIIWTAFLETNTKISFLSKSIDVPTGFQSKQQKKASENN